MRRQVHGSHRARRLFIILVLSAAVLGTAIYLFPINKLRRSINAQTASWLTNQFGPGTRIGDLDLNWSSLTIHDVSVPVGSHGSRINVNRVEAALDPVQLVAHPKKLMRTIRAIWLTGVDIHLAAPQTKSGNTRNGNSWIPKLEISTEFYDEIGRIDSLKEIAFENCRLIYDGTNKTPTNICEFRGIINQANPGLFRIKSRGIVLADSAFDFGIDGFVNGKQREMAIQATADVPRGVLPYWPDSAVHIATNGVGLEVQAHAQDSSVELSGSAWLQGLTITTATTTLTFDSLSVTLVHDSVTIQRASYVLDPAYGELAGYLLLRDQGLLNFSGSLKVDSLKDLHDSFGSPLELDGKLESQFAIVGDLREPRLQADARLFDFMLYKQKFDDAHVELSLTQEEFEVKKSYLSAAGLELNAHGRIALAGSQDCDITGELLFAKPLEVLNRQSELRKIEISIIGAIESPSIETVLKGDRECRLGELSISQSDNIWHAVSRSASGLESKIDLELDSGLVQLYGGDVHNILAILFPQGETELGAIRTSHLLFNGDNTYGDLEFEASVILDSNRLYTQIAQEIKFEGRYERTQPDRMILSGNWSGITADEQAFRGRGELILNHHTLVVNRLFIDDVGELSGWINPDERMLNLQLQISDLTAERFPVKPVFIQKARIEGDFSGYFEIQGSFDNPRWTANLAMTNGAILGVPGYWVNVESEGSGTQIQLRNVEAGRDVRKIIGVSGTVDLRNDSLLLNAQVGSARAEDFLLALSGRTGLFSGELDGYGIISGAITHPDIKAELAIRKGEMLNEIYVDEFLASFQTDIADDGSRIYRIPQCSFFKQGKYGFSGSAQVGENGESLTAHIEGNGDFLDLVDQVDRVFHTRGSNGSLRLDIGGTLQSPTIIGGSLALRKGYFVYADASPGLIATEIALSVAAGGTVEPGYIRFNTGSQWLEIAVVPVEQSVRPGLDPLVIPYPRLKLGTLEIRSGSEGMPLRVSGLMKPVWYGPIAFGTDDAEPVTISAWGDKRLLIRGDLTIRNTRMTFPFVKSSGNADLPVARWLVKRLEEAQWDLRVAVGSGNHYDVEITGLKNSEMFAPLRESTVFETLADYIDHLSIDAIVDPSDDPIRIRGTIDDSTFFLIGRMTASRGVVEYLDQTFSIDYVTADFDETNVFPILEGRAEAEGTDSLGRNVPVYLTMYQIDRETNIRQKRGRFDKVTFVLEGDADETPEQVLVLLGYDPQAAGAKAGQVFATTFARVIGRQWLDPLERHLERWTLLDEVALNPGGGRASPLARQQRDRAATDTLDQNSTVRFFTGSQVTVGKYLTPNLFVTYTGELTEGQIDVGTRIGLIHLWNLEYRMEPLSRDLVVDFAVEYDEVERKRDESISLKYSFALEP
ncbi:MAG: translocation/assembly module TamB domain-containing protein [Calditrichota bacterium]